MKKYLFAMALFVAAFSLTSCSSDDDNNENVDPQEDSIIIGVWHVQGFGSEVNFHSFEEGHTRFMSLESTGWIQTHFDHYHLWGQFEYNDQGRLTFLDGQVQRDPSWDATSETVFLEEFIQPHKTLNCDVTWNYLKLYYSADEYILFERGMFWSCGTTDTDITDVF